MKDANVGLAHSSRVTDLFNWNVGGLGRLGVNRSKLPFVPPISLLTDGFMRLKAETALPNAL